MQLEIGTRKSWLDDGQRWSRWMAEAHGGDTDIYQRLLSELGEVIYKYLLVRYGRAAWLEDMVQECLIALHKGRHTYDPQRPFRPWMFAIVRNRSVDFLRSEKPGRYTQQVAEEANTDGYELDQLIPIDLERSIDRLKPDFREALTLTKYAGLSIEEAATWSGVSHSAMKTRVSRAVHALRKQLNREEIAYE